MREHSQQLLGGCTFRDRRGILPHDVTIRTPAQASRYRTVLSRLQAFLTAWTSIRTLTLSPTSRPPLSSAAFQFKPNSRRLSVVSAVNPATSLPNGFLPRPL